MAKTKGLGRGLNALFASENSEQSLQETTALPVDALRPGKFQPRYKMDPTSISELAQSIKSQGVLQPILVRPGAQADEYEIIAGERRWRAAQEAGLRQVPVLVRNMTDENTLSVALIENLQREDLNALEEAAGIKRLIEEFRMTHENIAKSLGRSRSAVTNLLRLLALTEPVQKLLLQGAIEMGHARALLALGDKHQIAVAHQIVSRGLTVREAERLISKGGLKKRQEKAIQTDPDVHSLEIEISDIIGLRVKLLPNKKGGGKLVLEYPDLDSLDGFLEKLK